MTEEPLYNIGVVTRVTGITIPTLYAWERRYHFPQATRTSGGHRLYSEKDIARLRWVKTQVDSGMAASRAVVALHSLEEKGQFHMPSKPEIALQPRQITTTSNLQDQLFELLIHHDLPTADKLMGEILAFSSPEELTLQVIGPTLARIGEAWESGQITITTEHLASNYLRHRLLRWMAIGPSLKPGNPIVLACAPGELHEGSLLMLGVLLRRRGWPISYLGQDVPLQSLAEFINEVQPPAIVLVAMRETSARTLLEWPKHVLQLGGKPAIMFGGRIFVQQPEFQQLVPGHYLGDDIPTGIARLETILI